MSEKGLVFDIKRGSVNDGPGIRTTVFLKGCPLDCTWCHNPESKSGRIQLKPDAEISGKVAEREIQEHSGKHIHINEHFEVENMNFNVPHQLSTRLGLIGKWYTVEELLDFALKDKLYYQESGGGLTLSGGEPLYQFDFAKNLLQKANEEGIHTCVDTSGYVRPEKLVQITQLTSLFLYDVKLRPDDKHKQYCGVSNTLILNNLDVLNQAGSPVILRSPVVPGINDSEEHRNFLFDLQKKYSNIIDIEFLPYHEMGIHKYGF